jgi:hypothetical protein
VARQWAAPQLGSPAWHRLALLVRRAVARLSRLWAAVDAAAPEAR